jgi:hypothetical protein
MDDSTIKTLLISLFGGSCLVFFIYSSWYSRFKLRQLKELPTVMQVAGFHLFQNPKFHEMYRFLPTFKSANDEDRTMHCAKKRDINTEITAFVYTERRKNTNHYTPVLMATLSHSVPDLCIYTRSTVFGPITPANHRVFKTNNPELEKIFRITAASEDDFRSLITLDLQKFLLQNQDITQLEISQKTIALFNSDNRFFQLVTTNGIPSAELFNRQLKQLSELQRIIETTQLRAK